MNENIHTRVYRLLLRLYPQDHRRAFSEEMVGVFNKALAEARRKGAVAVITFLFRELFCLPAGLAQAYAQSWRQTQPAVAGAPDWSWTAGWAAGTTIALPLAWLLMAPLAGLLLLFVRWFGAADMVNPGALRAFGFLLALALLMAIVQRLFLRRYEAVARLWFGATFAGWLIGGAMLLAVADLSSRLSLAPERLMPVVFPPILGLAVGVAQMLILRRLTLRAAWWLPVNLIAFSSILLAGRAFESLFEFAVIFSLPGAVSAAGLRWLLKDTSPPVSPPDPQSVSAKRPWFKRPHSIALIVLALMAFCALAPWAFATAQIELAKSEGIYASPEEAIITRHSEGWGGARVVSIENVRARPNRRDGMDHVWFGGARVTYDRVPAGGRHDSYEMGSFYIRVRDGWVHVPEGALPELVGRLMLIYNIEMQ